MCAREREREKEREKREKVRPIIHETHAIERKRSLARTYTFDRQIRTKSRAQESKKKNKIESSKRERTIVCLETALTWTCGNQREREREERERG